MRSEGNVYNPVPEKIGRNLTPEQEAKTLEEAITITCDRRLHRLCTFSADPPNGLNSRICVSYSDLGRPAEPGDGYDKPVILWASGMFGGRYLTNRWGQKAEELGIRLLAVDRPGIGGTTRVPLEQRISTWVAIIPLLLKHLDIKYVSLASHSAGSMFILSTAMMHRHLLHPERPFMAFFGPWVPPQYSGKQSLRLLQYLPRPLLATWDSLALFTHNYIAPTIDLLQISYTKSRAIPIASISKPRKSPSSSISSQDETKQKLAIALENAIQHLVTTYIFKENVSGASDEVLLCLGKGETNWIGIGAALEKIVAAEKETQKSSSSSTSTPPQPSPTFSTRPTSKSAHPLRIQVYYAENDEMIGKGGTSYLHRCLKRAETEAAGAIQREEFEVQGADHNNILDHHYEAGLLMMEAVAGRWVVDGDEQEELSQAEKDDELKFCRRMS